MYFVDRKSRDITPDKRANLVLLEALLDQAYNSGYEDCKKGVDKRLPSR